MVVPGLLDHAKLDERDRGFVTELVYGTTRMRRACDWLVDRFLFRPVEPDVRNVLRLGAYQLVFLQTPGHAAVSATVDLVHGPARGLVNAVLRKVAAAAAHTDWPDEATRLSYPDWIVERLTKDIGHDDAVAALEQMNQAAHVTERADGYVQDEASQWVAELVGAQPRETIADVCAAPGGKATLLAASLVAAGDVHPSRAALVQDNARRLRLTDAVATYVADARNPPFRPETFDRVLVDAPCSGLGVLRRRPDARWRVAESDVDDLTDLQRNVLDGSIPLLKPGGTLVYSVCTLTDAESVAIDEWLADAHPDLVPGPDPTPAPPWQPHGRGARLLPQAAGTDGMYVLRLRRGAR